jgi:outer membrane protein assembly factor BamB
VFGPRAERLLGEGQTELVERSLLLTPAGLEGAASLAQSALEDARFEHARTLLEQLDKHPDRHGERGRPASRLMTTVARYLDRQAPRDLAIRWAAEAGAGLPDLTAEPWPAAAVERAATPMRPVPATNAEGMVSKPLWTVPLNPSAAVPEANLNAGAGRGQVSVPAYARYLLLIPSASADTVYVNDGAQVGAWDRFTLAPRWTVTPGLGDAPAPEQGVRGNRRRVERFNGFGGYSERTDDLSTVAVSGRFIVAATGRTTGGSRGDGDDRVQALDAQTGRIRWAVQLNVLDPPALYDASVHGPIQIVEGVVVFAARKHLPDRRLVSFALVGLDLNTGKLLWVRPVGSAGSMPWIPQSMAADGITVVDGAVYRADRLGVVGAVDAGTGRPRWVRRLSVDTASGSDQPTPWQMGCPVPDGSSIILIAPDAKRILRLDRASGAIVAQRDLADFAGAHPRYLLRVGDTLACVGEDRVAFIPAATFEAGKPVVAPAVAPPGIRGRCVVSGDAVIMPTVSGYSAVRPTKPDQIDSVALEESGNVLPLESQLIVLDDSRLHSYLRWEVAEALLAKRIEQDPGDPAPAVTYTELAYRADKGDKILTAARLAVNALKKGPQNDATWSARARLIDSLQGMLATALDPAPLGGDPAAPKGPTAAHPITDRPLLEQLVALLGEISFQPEDKLAHILALGRLSELNTMPEDAVASYQRVLSDSSLGGATWHGPQVSIRGELEATRRIESLLRQHGTPIYAAQERDAAAQLAALGPSPTEQQLEILAGKFPLAQQTPGVWSRIADLRTQGNKVQPASAALEAALRSATRQPDPPQAVVGEIAGRLIVGLRERHQLAAAAGVLRAVRSRFPGLALTASGQALDSDKLGAELAQRIAASMRWPRVGPVRPDKAQAIAGWSIMEPLLSDRTPSVTNLLPLASDDEIGIWAAPTTDHADKHELLVKAWSQRIGENAKPSLIRTTPDAAYFAVVKDSDVVVTKVGSSPLEAKWKTEPLGKVFGAADARSMRRPAGAAAGFATPAEGEAQPTNLIVAMDDRTLVLVQRAGKAAAFDTDSGELLWTARVGVGRVYDADLMAGTLALGGDQEIYGAGGIVTDLKPVVQILDARTGRPAQRIGELTGHVRWIGFTEAGSLIAALDGSVVCLDLASGHPNWTITHPDAIPVSGMWIFGDQLVMADQNRAIWLASISTGRLRPSALDVPHTHIDMSQSMDAFPLAAVPGTGFGIATQQGLALFGPEGTLTGVDGMDGSTSMIRPRPADGRALTIETIADGRSNDGLMMFTLHALDVGGPTGAALLDSRPILLGARPNAMTLLDERVAVTAGNVTVILQAPAAPK